MNEGDLSDRFIEGLIVIQSRDITLHGVVSAGGLLTGILSSAHGIRSALLVNGAAAMALQLGLLAISRDPE